MWKASRQARGLLLASAAACLPRPAQPAPESARYVLHADGLFDPGGERLERDVVVVVQGHRIVEATPSAQYRPQPGDEVIDLTGLVLMPGLIDAHAHLSFGDSSSGVAQSALRAGFTTVADLGERSLQAIALRDSSSAEAWRGPRVLAAGVWVGARGGVCEFGGIGLPPVEEAFLERTRSNVRAGADLIKICVTGWPGDAWSYPDSAELQVGLARAVVQESHRSGRAVVAHALSRRGVLISLDAGVDGLAHAAYLDRGLALRMSQAGMWMIPTLASLTDRDTTPAARALAASVRLAYQSGVSIVFGTDATRRGDWDGAAEAVALVEAGLPPGEVLRAATVNAARALGIADSVGVLEPGMSADIIAVPGDPRRDIRLLARPGFIMARGRIIRQPGAPLARLPGAARIRVRPPGQGRVQGAPDGDDELK
jgi:imidazolonepropionase-like amidohydrolase